MQAGEKCPDGFIIGRCNRDSPGYIIGQHLKDVAIVRIREHETDPCSSAMSRLDALREHLKTAGRRILDHGPHRVGIYHDEQGGHRTRLENSCKQSAGG
jgi:hypothetical protein